MLRCDPSSPAICAGQDAQGVRFFFQAKLGNGVVDRLLVQSAPLVEMNEQVVTASWL